MGVGVASEDGSEEGRARREDDFVGLDLLIITGQSHIEEVFVVPQFTERCGDVGFKVVPPKAELFRGHFQASGLG